MAGLVAVLIASLLSAPLWLPGRTAAYSPATPRQQAAEELERVKSGHLPTCQAAAEYGIADGGTLVYECGHYQLTVKHSLATQDGVDGYLYGPIIVFDSGESMSDVRFYTSEELSKLLASRDGL